MNAKEYFRVMRVSLIIGLIFSVSVFGQVNLENNEGLTTPDKEQIQLKVEGSPLDKNDDNWYKSEEDHFWIDPSDPWDTVYYGMVTNNKFDWISNTCGKIIYDGDTSEWAHEALKDCAALLTDRVRWPYWANQEDDPKTRIGWRSRRVIQKLHLTKEPYVYGHRKRMSRDPFINFYAACVMLDQMHHIENITIPWYLYRPGTWRWRKRLIEDNREHYRQRLTYLYGKAVTIKLERL